jgi:hypothetical protein
MQFKRRDSRFLAQPLCKSTIRLLSLSLARLTLEVVPSFVISTSARSGFIYFERADL